jgi:hypothetical protein
MTGTDQPERKTMTRADGERYRKALEDICAHMVIVGGAHFHMSTAWQIANKSLTNGESQ